MSELLSLPKDRIKILLLEGVNDTAVQFMGDNGYAQITRLPKALDGEALKEALRGVHLLGIRSRTQLTADVLDAADRLVAVGCFCIGTNQVDLAAARERGIVVFNAPFSNTRSVAELVMGEIIVLLRGVLPKSNAAHAGVWQKTADGFHEVRGRTLGIVGYGNIGSQLSVLAEAFGMRVLYHDHTAKLPHGNAQQASSLADLLRQSDVVTVHVPETSATIGMIGAAALVPLFMVGLVLTIMILFLVGHAFCMLVPAAKGNGGFARGLSIAAFCSFSSLFGSFVGIILHYFFLWSVCHALKKPSLAGTVSNFMYAHVILVIGTFVGLLLSILLGVLNLTVLAGFGIMGVLFLNGLGSLGLFIWYLVLLVQIRSAVEPNT